MYICTSQCGSSSVVEHQLPKLRVAGSTPVSRSRRRKTANVPSFCFCRKIGGKRCLLFSGTTTGVGMRPSFTPFRGRGCKHYLARHVITRVRPPFPAQDAERRPMCRLFCFQRTAKKRSHSSLSIKSEDILKVCPRADHVNKHINIRRQERDID